ncbi:Protein CBG15158 [Caenorhabditis briggsae]|uniref:Protein CBG15158 n=1 Tax=Caenorhabditis briggsae TaxID=6238 RepID=A8XLT3_CAEBR|nr:Protein CBG15158 [Caenorhabditis briggsae]CAP33587.2 Protein CBG15158 [Caenorhabditis briggsae]
MIFPWRHWNWLLVILQTVACFPISDTLESGNFSRSRRAPKGDKLSPLVLNFQTLARLINGVSMEAGLLTGLIPSEDLVSELLHMGSIKPKHIINLDSKILNDALTGLAELPTKLKSTTEIGNLEARFVLLEDVRTNSSFVHHFKNYTGRVDYNTHLEDAQKLDGFKNEIQKMKNEANALNSALLNTVTKTEANVSKVAILFPSVHDNLLDTETGIQGFGEVVDLVDKILLTRDSSKFIDLFELENENRIKLKDSQLIDEKARSEFVENMKQVYTSRTNAQKAQDGLKTIHQLTTESNKRQKTFLYTSGFINQFEDLDTLAKDSENGWIAGHMNQSKLVSESLKKAFGALDSLKTALNSVRTKWIPLNKPANQKSFEVVQNDQLNIAQVPDNPEDVYKTVSAFLECDENVDYPGKVRTVDDVKAKIEELSGLMQKIENMDYFESLKDLSILKALVDVTGKNDDQKKELGLKLIKIMKSETPEKKMIQNLKRLETNLDVLLSVSPQINKLAKEMDLTVPDKLHNDLAKKSYLEIYTCLEKIGDSGKAVKDMVQMIQKIRTNKKGSEDIIVKGVLESVDYLKDVKKSADKMKEVRAPEALALNSSFPDSQKFSNMIGMAVRGLTSILEIHQKRDVLKPFLENMDDIKNDAKAKKLTPEQEQRIKDLARIKEELMKTLAAIDIFRKNLDVGKMRRKRRRAYRRPRNAKIPNFKSLQTVLKNAAKIPGVIFVSEKELEEIKKTMNALNTANSKNAVTALESLQNLNLDFSGFGFQGAIASLAAIDRFFESYSKAMYKASSSGPQSISGGSNQSMPQRSPVSQWYEDPAVMAPTGVGVVFVGLVIFFILLWLGYCRCLCCKKEGKYNELDRDDTQRDEDDYFSVGKTVYTSIMAQNSNNKTPHYWAKEVLGHLKGLEKLKITDADKKENIAERRYEELICIKDTAVSLNGFDDPFINANVMKFEKKGSCIMSQAPLDGNEQIRNQNGVLVYQNPRKKSTIEKHWAMIDQYNVQGLVMTCAFIENDIKKCPAYFPLEEGGEVEFGRYKIKTISVEKNLKQFTDKKNFTLYTIEYKNTLQPQQPPKSLKLLQYTGWPDHGSPTEPEPALEIFSFINQFENGNVLIHCHAGIGRTGTLVALKNGMEMVKTTKNLNIIEVLFPVRKCRYNSIQTPDQLTYLALCMTKATMKSRNVPYLKEFDALQYFHNKVATGKYNLTEKDQCDEAFMERFCAEDKAEMEEYCKRKREEYEAAEKKRKEKEKELGPPAKNGKKSKEMSKEQKKKSKENPKNGQKKDQKKPKPAVKK